MKIYDIEKECGLEKAIANASVCFETELINDSKTKDYASAWLADYKNLAEAHINDDDLYRVYSILVTSSWNKNDDIFSPEEVWAARDTPVFKPTNLEHDEKQMVGAMVDSWAVDEEFNLIADDIDPSDLPDQFHILASSVIYRQWQDPKLKSRAEQLISEIEDGTKYVSMECIFRGFDYGIRKPDGTNHVLARDQDTAFLTQHLRAYGGDGTYQDHKIGRVLRQITFSGKGFVDKPANPESVIFGRDTIFSFAGAKNSEDFDFLKNGVKDIEKQLLSRSNISTKENNDMSDVLNEQIKELKASLASLTEDNKALNDKLAEANISQYDNKIAKLEATVAELTESKAGIEADLDTANTKATELETSLAAKSEELEKIQADMHSMKKEKKDKDRKEEMVKAGLSPEEVEAKYDAFADLSDEQFTAVVETFANLKKGYGEEDKDKAMKEKAMKEKAMEEKATKEAKADDESSDVDAVEASEIVDEVEDAADTAVSSDSEEDEISATRASLQEWVEKNVIK